MNGASFMVDTFDDIVDVLVQYSHSMLLFFCARRGEFVVVIKVYGACIKAIETTVW